MRVCNCGMVILVNKWQKDLWTSVSLAFTFQSYLKQIFIIFSLGTFSATHHISNWFRGSTEFLIPGIHIVTNLTDNVKRRYLKFGNWKSKQSIKLRNLVGPSPWNHKELGTAEPLSTFLCLRFFSCKIQWLILKAITMFLLMLILFDYCHCPLGPLYLNCGPQTSSSSITWELVRKTPVQYWVRIIILTRSQDLQELWGAVD